AVVERRQRLQDGLRAADDPDRLAAPLQDHALALGQRADVRGHGRAGELGALAREPALDERNRGHAGASGADHRGGGCQEAAAAMVDRAPLDRIQYPFIAHRHSENRPVAVVLAATGATPAAAGPPSKTMKCSGTVIRGTTPGARGDAQFAASWLR